jgi:hypothetical protein
VGNRAANLFRSQDILSILAKESGGTFVHSNNDVAGAIRRAADDQDGYYLIGYEPGESTFAKGENGRVFHELSVKVKRPGLSVRSRTGFYGMTDEEARVPPRSLGAQLVRAIRSPFGADGVQVALAPVFADDAKSGPHVSCLLHFDAHALTFVESADGARKVTIDTAVVMLNEYGLAVEQEALTHAIDLDAKGYDVVLRNGLDYTTTFPVEKPGRYQVRAAVRDSASQRVGATFQSVDVPNLKKNRFALSSISLGTASGVNATDTAARRFRRGDVVVYGFEVYNARRDPATKAPSLLLAARLYRDGELVYTGPSQPLEVGQDLDARRVRAGRALQLGTEMQPGSYVLQITVTDPVPGKEPRSASRWIDFDVAP